MESANHFGVTALMEASSSLRSKAVAVSGNYYGLLTCSWLTNLQLTCN